MYGAAFQQDIDNFVNFVGEGQSYPPAFTPDPLYQLPSMLPGCTSDLVPPTDAAQLQQPPHLAQQTQARHDTPQQQSGALQQSGAQQQLEAQQAGLTSPLRSNIVPFKRKGKPNSGGPGPDNQPGSIESYFVDEDISQDMRPILLFDLNGTLTSHTAAKRSSGRSLMRPGIQHLRRLQVK